LESKANQAVSFFVKLRQFNDDSNFQSLTLENGQTQEKMVIKRENDHIVTISRYPIGTNEEEWDHEMRQPPNIDNRKISFL
jgi:hypothetical protein